MLHSDPPCSIRPSSSVVGPAPTTSNINAAASSCFFTSNCARNLHERPWKPCASFQGSSGCSELLRTPIGNSCVCIRPETACTNLCACLTCLAGVLSDDNDLFSVHSSSDVFTKAAFHAVLCAQLFSDNGKPVTPRHTKPIAKFRWFWYLNVLYLMVVALHVSTP